MESGPYVSWSSRVSHLLICLLLIGWLWRYFRVRLKPFFLKSCVGVFWAVTDEKLKDFKGFSRKQCEDDDRHNQSRLSHVIQKVIKLDTSLTTNSGVPVRTFFICTIIKPISIQNSLLRTPLFFFRTDTIITSV